MNLASRVSVLSESATLAVSSKAAKMIASGIDVVTFGAGEPECDTPGHIKQAAIDALLAGHTAYSKPASGIASAREAVCEKLRRVNGLSYSPDQVIITPGGKMGVHLAVQAVVEPGAEVVVPVPYWVSYPEIVTLAGGVSVFVTGREAGDYKLTPSVLESVLSPRTRLVILNSPCNPSGVTYDPEEIRALAAVLSRYDTWVLSDEIYDQFVFGGQRTLSYAAVGPETYARAITLNAPSKTYAMTGWRLGYVAGPVEVIRAMGRLQSQMTSGACTFNQYALAEALTADQDEVEQMRSEYERRGAYMYERLTALEDVRCPRPTGAFYCFPNVGRTFARVGVSGSAEFAERLLAEARVAVVPGAAFGLDGHVRLSFGGAMDKIRDGMDRIERFLGGR
jgi:aspartate aminotransferase